MGFPGMNARVNDLTTYAPSGARGDARLIAAGTFTTAGDDSASAVAEWDGSDWHDLDGGVYASDGLGEGALTALAVQSWSGDLYVGGTFDRAGSALLTVSNIASWDGTEWSDVAGGTDGAVHVMSTYNDQLLVGGAFSAAGVTSAGRIAAYDGTSWSRLGDGVSGNTARVYDVVQWNDLLVVGGRFINAGPGLARNIAAWDGTAWSSFGAGLDNDVFAVATYNDELYAAGLFSAAQGLWNSSSTTAGSANVGWLNAEVDPFDRIHLVYYDTAAADLFYAYETEHGDWTTEVVDAGGDVGNYCDLFLVHETIETEDDTTLVTTVHVAYFDATNEDPKYAVRPPEGPWTVETLDEVTTTTNGMYTSIVVDRDGDPVIAFQSLDPAPGSPMGLRQSLAYPNRSGGSFRWTTVIVDTGNRPDRTPAEIQDVGSYTELEIGPTGRLHLVHRADNDDELLYTTAARTRGGWSAPEVVGTFFNSFRPHLAVDDSEIPHLSNLQIASTFDRVWYRNREGGVWGDPLPVSPRGTFGESIDLRIDDDGRPHVVYYDRVTGRIGYGFRGHSEFEVATVEMQSGLGGVVAAVLYEGREPRTIYLDTNAGTFRKGVRAPSNQAVRIGRWNQAVGVWENVGGGLDWWARDLLVHEGELVVAGAFTRAGVVPANRVARWNGSSFSPEGASFVSTAAVPHVWTLASHEGRLIAGGDFVKANGRTANYVVDLAR
jgi:hypothetical protein